MVAGVDSIFTNKNLNIGTRHLILPTVSLEIALRLGTCQTIINTICTGHWLLPYACVCFVVVECKGRAKDLFVVVVFLYEYVKFLIIIHQVLIHHIHTFSHPITHISPLSHSLGDKDDSRSYLASSAKAGNQHKNPGGEKKGLHSLIKGSVGHRNVHI